jgi:hypothetical protein
MTKKSQARLDQDSKAKLPRRLDVADEMIRGHSLIHGASDPGMEFLTSLSPAQLTVLRQATLRAHRRSVGPYGQGDPTIADLDTMIMAVGPVCAEDMIRKAVDQKRGEYDRGNKGHGLSNDATFLDRAKKA